MKTITVRDLQKRIRQCVELSQQESVVVTRHGRPAALLIGIQGRDWEDVLLENSPAFWKMIEKRRRQRTVPFAEAKKRLARRRRALTKRPARKG